MAEHNLLDVLDLLEHLYMSGVRDSVLLLGDIGIGKSEGVRQLAHRLANNLGKEYVEFRLRYRGGEKEGIDYKDVYREAFRVLREPDKYFVLIDMRVSILDPVDLMGRPTTVKVGENVFGAYVPFLTQLVASACAGILCLDEFTCTDRDEVFNAGLQITLDRRMGDVELHPDMWVIACGNKPEHTVNARALPANNLDRFMVFEVRAPSIDEWKEYMDRMYGEEWDKTTYLYLKRCEKTGEKVFTRPDDVETLNKFATRRDWTKFAVALYKLKKQYEDGKITKEQLEKFKEMLAIATLGREVGMKYLVFERTKVPEPDKLIAKPELWLRLNDVQRYVALVSMANWLGNNLRWDDAKGWFKVLFEKDRESLVLFGKLLGSKADFVSWLITKAKTDKFVAELKSMFLKLATDVGRMRALR